MTAFPALVPSSRTFTPGEYPATAFSGYSGAQARVRHSNIFVAAQLRLSYIGLSEAEMLQVWNHYAGRRGTFEPFTLPAQVLSGSNITDYVPAGYRWIYSGPGQVEDLPCGGHNVSLALETVPPADASVSGVDLRIRLTLTAGAGGVVVAGLSDSLTLSLTTGAASTATTQAGLSDAIDLSLTAGAATTATTQAGVQQAVTLSLSAGAASAT